MKKILVFHPTIAPYRVDFFNDLFKTFSPRISLYYENLIDQRFNYDEISKRFIFQPDYFEKSIKIFGREIPIGFIKRIKNENPNIVIINEYSESFWISLIYRFISKKKYKIISICDDSRDIVKNEGGLHSKSRTAAIKYLDGIILCNDSVKDIYKQLYPNVNTVVMPIIQDETLFLKNRDEIVIWAKEIFKSEELYGKRVFLYVGRISPEKNLRYLVESFILDHSEGSDCVLYIIGDYVSENKLYNDEIDALITKNNAFSYIKKIGRKEGNELKSWLFVGQILVVPSNRESFSAVTNEALLCGNYVMISSVAGATCLIDSTNGEIIDVSKDRIIFDEIKNIVPCLTEEYIDNKHNKMKCSYKECINNLINWIKEL